MLDDQAPGVDGESPKVSGGSRLRGTSGRWLIAGAVVVAVPVLVYGAGLAASAGTIPSGTTVAGVSIGGLDQSAATQVLATQVAPRAEEPLQVSADSKQTTAVPAKAGIALDVGATVDAAAAKGRAPWDVAAGLVGNAGPVEPVLTVDASALSRSVTIVGKRLDLPMRDGGIKFVGTEAVKVAPVAGRAVDQQAFRAVLTSAALSEDRVVAAPLAVERPDITQADVDAAMRTIAKPVLSGPVTVRVSEAGAAAVQSVRVPVATFLPYVRVRSNEGELELAVNGPALRNELGEKLGDLEKPARDATFRISGGRPVVVPSTTGRSVSSQELAEAFAVAAVDDGARLAKVRLVKSNPTLTTAKAKQLGVKERLSGFTQNFPYAAYRYQNIGEAAKRINGTLLLPGETFSMNDIAKERTLANGYTSGFVITDGRLTEDLGGGVSTITTAVWDAAFFAGLERVEQRAHSFFISRYKPGLEATVSWGNLDLRFRNNTGNAVFITAERGRTFVNVSMYGTKKGEVTAEFGPRTNVKPFKKVYDGSSTCTPQTGVNGFTIVVTRVFKEGGEVVKRQPLRTTYRPAANVLCRAAPTPKATTTPKPTSSPKASPKPA